MKKLIITLVGLGVLGASFANADFRRDHEAEKQVTKAIEKMDNALPIYNGKRADAEVFCRRARKDIFEATYRGERYNALRDNDDVRHYGPGEVGQSQRNMLEAKKHIDRALGDLRRSDGSYDETNAAVRDLRKAKELTDRCLQEYRR